MIVGSGTDHVLVELCKVTFDGILLNLHLPEMPVAIDVILLAVDDATVGLVAVGIGVCSGPVDASVVEIGFAGKLSDVSSSGIIEVLGLFLIIA